MRTFDFLSYERQDFNKYSKTLTIGNLGVETKIFRTNELIEEKELTKSCKKFQL